MAEAMRNEQEASAALRKTLGAPTERGERRQ
jgi:hypothetical protein